MQKQEKLILRLPLITIGLTTYNAEDTVERAVNSALSQSYRPIEIVVVDDCSTDQTLEILRLLSIKHSELRVFANPVNGGVSESRNHILRNARGEFVAFFDDDDESRPDRLEKQYLRIKEYERLHANGALVICHTARELHYPDGTIRFESTMGESEGGSAPSGLAVARRILLGSPVKDGYGSCATCSQMARLTTYQSIGWFDLELRRGEDTDFNIRLAVYGGHFVGIGCPLVIQKMTKTPEKSLENEYENMRILLAKHRNIMEVEGDGVYSFCCDWVQIKYEWLQSKYLAFLAHFLRLMLIHPILTFKRLIMALPNIRVNRAFSRFHLSGNKFK